MSGKIGKTSRGFYSLAQPPKVPLSLLAVCLSPCLSEPASHSRRPSLIIENGLPLSWVVPSLLGPRHWLPAPRAGEAHLVLQPWHGALALLGMDAHTLRANLVVPAFLYSLHLCLCVQRPNAPFSNYLNFYLFVCIYSFFSHFYH